MGVDRQVAEALPGGLKGDPNPFQGAKDPLPGGPTALLIDGKQLEAGTAEERLPDRHPRHHPGATGGGGDLANPAPLPDQGQRRRRAARRGGAYHNPKGWNQRARSPPLIRTYVRTSGGSRS